MIEQMVPQWPAANYRAPLRRAADAAARAPRDDQLDERRSR